MASPKIKGRMLSKDISRSEKFTALSKESQILFVMIIPHLNSFGKLNGNAEFIKGEVCPLIEWLDIATIKKCLNEISEKTSLKWFAQGRMNYLHFLSWEKHQKLEPSKLGTDDLPSYPQGPAVEEKSTTSRELVSYEVKDQVKGEVKEEGKDQVKGQNLTFSSYDLKPHEEQIIKKEIATTLNHAVDSQANQLALDELTAKLANKQGIDNIVGYMRTSARNLGKSQ